MDIFPNWTFVPIIVMLIVLTFALNRLFFRPMGKTLEERDRRIVGARQEAEEIKRLSQDKGQEFERRLRDARREADQQLAGVKNAALGEKTQLVAQQRSETEKMLSQARADLRAKTEEARRKLQAQASSFAVQIASQILKRPVTRSEAPQT
jgi:F-type H+-transporting ATPase subunit b